MKKIILFELNEVPFRVMDEYCRRRPESALNRVLSRSRQYETFTEDELALDPWISWPTFHRGVPDKVHQILHLGQVLDDVDEKYPPLWQILHRAQKSVGVFGSLHSSAVPADARDYSFYVPDYFANKVYAHPASLQPFQELNLRMTRASARNVSRKLPIGSALRFAATAPALGVTARTVASVARHLFHERRNRDLHIRRRNFQPVLSADLFLKQLRRTRPQFATFYSNHVAAAMHRYWGATFPEDFTQTPLDPGWVKKYSEELTAAMDAFDGMLRKMVDFVAANPDYTLVVASSMGQAAIPAQHTHEFLTISDTAKFMAALGVAPGVWEERPAMVPCQCVVIPEVQRDLFLRALKSLSIDGNQMVESTKPDAPMSFDERERGFFQLFIQFDHYKGDGTVSLGGRTHRLEALGLGMMAHEDGVNCTAQHVKEGSLIVYSGSGTEDAQRTRVSTLDFVPSVLAHCALPLPGYMSGRASIDFT